MKFISVMMDVMNQARLRVGVGEIVKSGVNLATTIYRDKTGSKLD